MVLYKKRKGQAAIEFLMTYGWMLLVVLIVGALIFSFVDFGSLLPNKVELSNNLRASATESFASGGNINTVTIVFTYTGSKSVTIGADDGIITPDISGTCNSTWVRNADLDAGTTTGIGAGTVTDPITFLNGHTGVMEFDCSSLSGGGGLLTDDVLQGKIRINVQNIKTGLKTPSTGPLRITVTGE